MDNLRTDEEQVVALKQFWKDYGSAIVLGIAVSLAGVYGWRAWNQQQTQKAEMASALYQELVETSLSTSALQNGMSPEQLMTIEHLLESLKVAHSDTVYAQMGALMRASVAVSDDNLDTARTELKWILAQKKLSQEIAVIARLRLARVELADSQAETALSVLLQIDQPGDFRASYEDVHGDILLALGRRDEARAAYQLAVNLLNESGQPDMLVALKLDDLAEPGEKNE